MFVCMLLGFVMCCGEIRTLDLNRVSVKKIYCNGSRI
jgi:hypothetical protein